MNSLPSAELPIAIYVSIGAVMLAAACTTSSEVENGDTHGLVQVSVALKADGAFSATCPATLSYPDVRSVRLRLFDGTPDDPAAANALFDTSDKGKAPDGCLSFVQCVGANVRMDAVSNSSQDDRAQACKDAGGRLENATVIQVGDIKPRANITMLFEAFSDDNCTERTFIGLRGGVEVRENDPRTYYLSPLCVGHFSALPTPDAALETFTRNVALTTCTTDCECIDAFKNDLKKQCTEEQKALTSLPGAPIRCNAGACTVDNPFESLLTTECDADDDCSAIYPYSTCGTGNRCTLRTYFPLNNLVPRAFHAAAGLQNGNILFTGGLTRRVGNFVAGDAPVELFDPDTFTFQTVDYSGAEASSFAPVDLNRAFHTMALSRDGLLLALSGGLRATDIKVTADGAGVRRLKLVPSATGPDGGDNLLSNILLLDTTGSNPRAKVYPLEATVNKDAVKAKEPQPIALQAVDIARNGNNAEFMFSGGFAPKDTPATQWDTSPTTVNQYTSANLVANCVFQAPVQANCLVNPNVFTVARSAASTACFARAADGACDAFAIIGGAQSVTAPVGELFRSGDESKSGGFVALEANGVGELRRAKFSRVVSIPGTTTAVSIGGVSGEAFDGPANLPTYLLTLQNADGETPTLAGDEASTSGVSGGAPATFRTHHTATLLNTGKILITGGLNNDNRATSTALLYDPQANSYEAETVQMTIPRFGHSATLITRGPLKGAVLVSGGMNLSNDSDTPDLVPYSEIYVP
ncbi:MAG: hypothetical protein HUU55_01155 [Myxococcales bacterium]|nr:hypothetical protein [Myxococcales bacterium]